MASPAKTMDDDQLPPLPPLISEMGEALSPPDDAVIPRETLLDNDLETLRAFVAILVIITIIITGAVVGITVRNWLEGEIIEGASVELTARAHQYKVLVEFDKTRGFTGDGVVVCIVDSGIDLSHPDLDHLSLRGWQDFINNRTEPYDDHGHGTAMAGLLVADGGLHGLSKGVGLLVAKALSKDGNGSDQGVANAIDWCVSEGAEVISLSLGGAPGFIPSQFQGDGAAAASREAITQGVYVIAAAGNDGQSSDDDDVDSPCSEEDVICVGGVNENGDPWVGTSKGRNNGRLFPPLFPRSDPDKKPELVAPAERVPVLIKGGGWGYADGTSAATVYVTGAISVLLEGRPDLQRNGSAGGQQGIEKVKDWIEETVKPQEGQDGHDEKYGYGLLKVEALLDRAGAISPATTPTPTYYG